MIIFAAFADSLRPLRYAVKKQVQGAPDPPFGGHSFRQENAKNTMLYDKTRTRASGSAGAAVH